MRVPSMGEVKLKGVHRVKARGKMYYYHRATGTRLQSRYGTKAFVDEVYALNEMVNSKDGETLPGTWRALYKEFLMSDDFGNLAPRTKSDYEKRILGKLNIDGVPLSDMTPPTILQLRDAIRKKHGVKQANYTITVMSRIFKWGLPYGYVQTNPCEGVPKIRVKNKPRANRPWLPHEIQAVLREATPEMRLILTILLRTGLRSGDAVNLPWSVWDESGFGYRSSKTGVETWIVPTADLIGEVRSAPRVALTIATSTAGRPWTLGGLRSSWSKFKKRLEAQRLIGSGLTLHGIRHTVGNALADSGVGTSTIGHVLGHKSDRMASHYSDRAKRKKGGVEASVVIGRIGE